MESSLGLLIAAVVGYVVAAFAASNILLPLFWAWPKAKALERAGLLRAPIPAVRFLVPASVWSLLVLVTVLVVAAVLSEPILTAYLIGLAGGFGQITMLTKRPTLSMEEDFLDAYHDYISTAEGPVARAAPATMVAARKYLGGDGRREVLNRVSKIQTPKTADEDEAFAVLRDKSTQFWDGVEHRVSDGLGQILDWFRSLPIWPRVIIAIGVVIAVLLVLFD